MNPFKYNVLLSVLLFNTSPLFVNGGFSSAGSNPSTSSPHIKKESLANLIAIEKDSQTLADLLAVESQKEKEKPTKRKTLSELFEIEEIKAEEFYEFLNETKENEHLLDIVFVPQQNEKRQNRQQKRDKNDEKTNNSKEKQKLRLMYTAVDNLNIVANIKNDSDRKNKRNRRKKRFMESPLFMAILILLICSIFVYLVNNIGTWLYNRGWDPISLAQKAMSTFKQRNVSKAIKKMPEHQINGQSDGIQQCAICLSNYKQGEKVRGLMCKHNFHTKCVDIWIKHQNKCPICREEIFEISLLGKVRPKNTEQQQQHSTAVNDKRPENSLINAAENV
ncbi:hypothetical protein niasHT_036305 [Heterodera trifolii]|uniref:RING-type domain-containing protein n=1 Tax=Heterodera trifolii TaxID=157864 RepID=A0ABD2I8W4_9BILA